MFSGSLWDVQTILALIIQLGVLGLTGYALVDVLRQSKGAFPAAGKLTKPIWTAILAVAFALAIITFGRDLIGTFFISAITVVAAGVYLADVKPAVRGMSGGTRGPYGGGW